MSGVRSQWVRGATNSNERRIVLVGKTGSGKSAAGNTILGRKEFESKFSPSSTTAECQKARADVDGRKVAVIDTPGIFDTNSTLEEAVKKIKMCTSLSAPGPHAFLVVLQLGRFTKEEKETIEMIQTTFGKDADKYTMVLFTHGDRLKKKTIEDFISESADLQTIIRNCYNRYHVFNNEIKNPVQTAELLDKIDRMIMGVSERYYTNEMFMRAERAIEEEKERVLKEKEAQGRKELDALRAKLPSMAYQREKRMMYERYENEARAQAEISNVFIAAEVRAIVCCATIGGMLGATGGPAGAILGSVAGAAVGNQIAALSVKVSQHCIVQ